jgi:glycosyltransferase involved in cell wall biosynthesis
MSGPLRVAVIARSVRPLHGQGGLEQSVYDLVRHLARHDVKVTLMTPPPSAKSVSPDPFGSPNVAIEYVPYLTFPFANRPGTTILDRSSAYPLFGWRAGRKALALARKGSIDIVHAFGASGLGYALGHSQDDPPLVVNPQGLEEFEALSPIKQLGYAPLQAAVRATASRSAAIVVTDRSLEPVVQRHLKPEPGQTITIPNGIDLSQLNELAAPADGQRIRRQHHIGDDDAVLLSVGRVEHNKGFDVLARALGKAVRSGGPLTTRPWRWVLAGSGPYGLEIESVVKAEGLEKNVLLTGQISDRDLHSWYEAANVFIHPSRYEGSSLVTLEAMAHRRPIIATRAGGLPDKVRPGVNGWLVDVDSADGLATAIDEAASTWSSLPAMGLASRRIVEDEFSWAALIERYLTLYEQLRARQT